MAALGADRPPWSLERLRPVADEADRAAAVRAVTALTHHPPGSRGADLRDVVRILILDHDRLRWPDGDPSAIMSHALVALGKSQADLGRVLGSRTQAHDIVKGGRRPGARAIAKIEAAWGIPGDLLRRGRPPNTYGEGRRPGPVAGRAKSRGDEGGGAVASTNEEVPPP